MNENPYQSPECSDRQAEAPKPQPAYYGIPDWVFTVIALIAIFGTIVALLVPAIQ